METHMWMSIVTVKYDSWEESDLTCLQSKCNNPTLVYVSQSSYQISFSLRMYIVV